MVVIRKTVKRRETRPPESHRGAFEKEMATLRLLRTLSHPNIVPLLGSYTYDSQHNFLFPCFAMDLKTFLEQDAPFGEFRQDFTFYLALCGLASALEHTHGLHLKAEENGLDFDAIGYHHDLRPANILVSKSTFILADFGLGELKPDASRSDTPWKMGAGDYIAPECKDASLVHQRVGRAIDVWAFGCLTAEVMTYMRRGPAGVQKFRESRLADMRPGWQSTYFHDASGELKPSVRSWLEKLENVPSSPANQIIQTALRTLEPNPDARPRMSQIRRSLTIPALRALFTAVLEIFGKYMDIAEQRRSLPMQLWFEGERIRAFDGALSLDYDEPHIFKDFERYSACCKAIMAIFHRIESALDLSGTRNLGDLLVERFHDGNDSPEAPIQILVQNLWDLLPQADTRRAQAAWFQSMKMGDMDRLKKIDTYLQSHRRENSAEVGARTHMRAILLQMQNEPGTGAAEFFHPRQYLDAPKVVNGHTYGLFKRTQRVLVEQMYYRPERDAVPSEERLLVMQLRAKDFGTDPKPSGLRILKCLGFIEQIEEEDGGHGYWFLYDLPRGVDDGVFNPPVTLRQLLSKEVELPQELILAGQLPLRSKFQLAHSLALFFEEFYSVGCLHENFNPNNVIFAAGPTISWSQPYVVGFQKSRPDGQTWSTEGPSDVTKWQEYEQHPDYRRKGRFVLEYDYYSLGLVLLQIAGWTPLESWFRKTACKSMAPETFREHLRDKYVPRLAATVGEVYRDVVRTCLDGTLEQDRDSSPSKDLNKEVFHLFVERVAKPLEVLSQLCI